MTSTWLSKSQNICSGCVNVHVVKNITIKTIYFFHTNNVYLKKNSLTNISKQVFSLSAPTHPVKLMLNIKRPTTMKIRAGSRAMLVSLDTFWNTSFSAHAQSPMISNTNPTNCKRKQFRRKISKYFS